MGTNQRSQIEMTSEEIDAFVASKRTAILTTLSATGHPHSIAMWFGLVDGAIWFETKAKSQKAVNLRRDPRATILIEDGLTYDTLRGVSFEGTAEVIEDADALWEVGVSVWERYNGEYTEEAKPLVEFMLNKRIAVKFTPERTRSWDHRKLGLDPIPLGGTTAPEASA